MKYFYSAESKHIFVNASGINFFELIQQVLRQKINQLNKMFWNNSFCSNVLISHLLIRINFHLPEYSWFSRVKQNLD